MIVEIGAEFRRARRRAGASVERLAQRDDMVELARGLGEARIDAGDGAPIGLVAAGGREVGRALGERGERLAHSRPACALSDKFAAEFVQLVEIVAERARALQPHRLAQHVGGDERIAVAVAADPGADAQERADPLAGATPGRARASSSSIAP